jgi:two-component system chemotaxis response regulator CheB
MVSSVTEEGAETTLQALDLGALDYIPKHLTGNVLDIVHIESALREKVKVLGRRKVQPAAVPARPRPPLSAEPHPRLPRLGLTRIVAIGASTGGPPALQKLFSALSPTFSAPIVVVQHMPKTFTGPFARRLSQAGPLEVKEAQTGDRLGPGKGFVAAGGSHLTFRREGGHLVLQVTDTPTNTIHKPSVDVTFRSLAETAGSGTLAVILTGMGSDGLEGVRALRGEGCPAIAQSAQSCVVYGMPRAVVEAGLADAVLPIEEIAGAIEGAVG